MSLPLSTLSICLLASQTTVWDFYDSFQGWHTMIYYFQKNSWLYVLYQIIWNPLYSSFVLVIEFISYMMESSLLPFLSLWDHFFQIPNSVLESVAKCSRAVSKMMVCGG